MAVLNILKILNVKFKTINVLENQEIDKELRSLVSGQLYLSFILKKNL